MKGFTHPEVGHQIEVTIKNEHSRGEVFYYRHETTTYTGYVLNPDEDNPNHVRMTSGLPPRYRFPIRSIALDRIIKLQYVIGNEIVQKENVVILKNIEETVNGSKGNKYIVKRQGEKWFCSCIAGSFGKKCKHVTAMREKHESN